MKPDPRTALLAVALVVACGRGVAVESEPGPVYLINVENPMSHAMDIWYDDGMEARVTYTGYLRRTAD